MKGVYGSGWTYRNAENQTRCRTCHGPLGRKPQQNCTPEHASFYKADLEHKKQRYKTLQINPRVRGNCAKCGTKLTADNWPPSFRKRRVRRCNNCQYLLTKAWTELHPESALQKTERWRSKHPTYASDFYHENKPRMKERSMTWLWDLKIQTFMKLGSKCVRCGTTDPRVLQINHLKGGGGKEGRNGTNMYGAILRGERATDDVDLRCANCNIIYEYEQHRRNIPEKYAHLIPT